MTTVGTEAVDAIALSPCTVCDGCALARSRADETGCTYLCDCGERYEPRQRPSGLVDVATVVRPAPAPLAAPRRAPRLVYVAPDGDAPPVPLSPLARAGAAARSSASDDPDLVRVRRLLADLRPDCPDPLCPPVVVEVSASSYAPTIRDPSASWGGLPRGLLTEAETGAALDELARRSVAEVLATVDALPAPAPRVLRWARDHATLDQGLRGLFVDAGLWAGAGAATDLGARREAAYLLGRRLVLRACAEWEGRGA